MPKFAYFGTPYVARDTLTRLVSRGYSPAIVVTSPDAPKGRGMQLMPCETKEWALAEGLPVITPEKLDAAAIDEIRGYGCELGIVVAYGKLFPQALIDAFPKGVVNIHYSLLPKYRGASPVEAALLHGDTVTGVAIQRMALALDAGDVIATKEMAIGANETTKELRARLIEEGADLLASLMPALFDGTASATPQDETLATYSGRIQKEDGLLDLTGDARENWNKYRAYAESPGTYFFVERNGKRIRVKIKSARLENGAFVPDRIVPEGKKEMSYADFARQS